MEGLTTTNAGIIFIGVILVLREVFAFVAKKKNGSLASPCLECITLLRVGAKQVEDLHAWHNVRDTEGRPIWYARKSLEVAIDKLADNVSQQTKAIEHQSMMLEKIVRD